MSQDEGSGTRLADMCDCISASIGGFICDIVQTFRMNRFVHYTEVGLIWRQNCITTIYIVGRCIGKCPFYRDVLHSECLKTTDVFSRTEECAHD